MKIIADENIPYVQEAFGRLGEVLALPGRSISADNVHEADLLLVRSITRVDDHLLGGSRIRFVASATIGADHVDLRCLRRRGISFANAPGSNANSVGEYVVAALLVLAQRMDFELAGGTVGVVGVGNVGSNVAAKCEALGIRVIRNDPPLVRETGDPVYRPIEELLEQADIITCHVPLTYEGPDATFQMIDAEFFGRLRRSPILINTARGKVASGEAIARALAEGRLSAAVLDVWEAEPEIDPELLARVQLATPHIAGYSLDGKVNGTEIVYRAACDFLGTEPDWDPSPILSRPPVESLAISCEGKPDQEVIAEAVLSAYNIRADDRRMREALGCDPTLSAASFDRLRQDYPIRREFPNTALRLSGAPAALAEKLRGLGFRIMRPQGPHRSG
jgi:erythronate-4-phosphate dehydrogenase